MATPHQRALTISSDGILQVIECNVGIRISALLSDSQQDFIEIIAVWDTGATHTVISASFAQENNFPATGKASTRGVHGTNEVDTYTVDIILPNRVGFRNWVVSSGNLKCGLLIGMDIINLGDLAITNVGGKTVFSFQTPPGDKPIDFVKEIKQRNANPKYARLAQGKKGQHGKHERKRR